MTGRRPRTRGAAAAPDESGGMPLPALLGRVQNRYVAEFDELLGAAGYPYLSLAHGANVLRHLGGGLSLSSADLVRRTTISKQAMSQQVRHLTEHGVLREEHADGDSRVKLLRLTPQGEAALRAYQTTFADVEARWRTRHGDVDVDLLKVLLQRIWDA